MRRATVRRVAADRGMNEEDENIMVEVVPHNVPVGAEVRGVDLSQELDEATFATIRNAFYEHSSLVFRNQTWSEQQHVDFSRRLGTLRKPRDEKQFLYEDYPDLTRLSNILKDGQPIGAIEAGQYWHTDRSFAEQPSGIAVLFAIEVPRDADGKALGDTMLASAQYAYDTLSDEMKARVANLKAVHYYLNPYRTKEMAYASTATDLPSVVHPVVRTHPVTGRKGLYVNDQYTWKIEGMDEEEGRALIGELTAHITRADRIYRHSWQEGDVLLWDDCAAQHRAIGDYKLPQRRLLRRTTVVGSRPV